MKRLEQVTLQENIRMNHVTLDKVKMTTVNQDYAIKKFYFTFRSKTKSEYRLVFKAFVFTDHQKMQLSFVGQKRSSNGWNAFVGNPLEITEKVCGWIPREVDLIADELVQEMKKAYPGFELRMQSREALFAS